LSDVSPVIARENKNVPYNFHTFGSGSQNYMTVLFVFQKYIYIDFISQHSAATTETHTNDIVKKI